MELSNSHFASQCTQINNSSVLPSLEYKTTGRLASVDIKEGDINLILKNLNPEKAHGWDNISIRMFQLCGKAIMEPLQILFLTFLEEGLYPDSWKKSNIVTIQSENLIKNYRSISLLPVFSKVFERIIFNSLFNYFLENKLFNEFQSDFLSGDSSTSQLLSITHEIYKSFDCNPSVDVRETFLDILKTFDKVWHDGFIYKLKSYGVENKLLNLIQNYLTDRQQRVLLNGQTSEWTNILGGVPQGFVLGLLLFLIYIKDLPDDLKSICEIFSDDTSLFLKINDIDASNIVINNDLVKISRWAYQWKMSFNPDINKQATEVYFSQNRGKSLPPPIVFQ